MSRDCRPIMLAACLAALTQNLAAQTLLFEAGFEDGLLDPRLSITTVGRFNVAPGISELPAFGSARAFGFGLSSCSANCFSSYSTTLTLHLQGPTYVSAISFKEMERYDNWGSNGAIFLDGVPLFMGSNDFGRLPYNDRQADGTYRTHNFQVNRLVTDVQLQVYDITNRSEIFLDDLVVTTVPEPAAPALLLGGMAALIAWARRGRFVAGST